ncbi:MAG: ClpXP protease specificity-enhancing factor, partial [Thiobacillus sp.]|nr:ClpXP protease specificity-enhancing factor [Thiobacillus sp.]
MASDAIPQQPYFLRALYEWCVDSGYTPYVTVKVEKGAKV